MGSSALHSSTEKTPRVVVTGLGAVSPYGMGADCLWRGLLAGASAVRRISGFDPDGIEVQIAAEVPGFVPSDFMDVKLAKRMDRFAQFAVAAAGEAVAHSRLAITDANRERIASVIHTGGGGLWTIEHNVRAYHEKGAKSVQPLVVPLYVPNMASCQVAIAHGIHGPTLTGVAACAAGVMAIIEAVNLIQSGVVDVAIAGGSEACLTPTIMTGFANTGALSTRNDDPAGACRPFAADRDGTVLGEGAVVVVLESEAHAVRRHATALAYAHGGTMTSDGQHVTAPDLEGTHLARAMRSTLRRAGLDASEIDLLVPHGTGSHRGDLAELAGIRAAFGDHARRLAVPAIKSMIGHLIGASGAVASLVGVRAIAEGIVPPTRNIATPDPACDLDLVPETARTMRVRSALVSGIAFGGQNAAAAFSAV